MLTTAFPSQRPGDPNLVALVSGAVETVECSARGLVHSRQAAFGRRALRARREPEKPSADSVEILAAQSGSVAQELEALLDSSALMSREARADLAAQSDCRARASELAVESTAAFARSRHSFP